MLYYLLFASNSHKFTKNVLTNIRLANYSEKSNYVCTLILCKFIATMIIIILILLL